jgi:DNA-binding IclR family transcriptional regulator
MPDGDAAKASLALSRTLSRGLSILEVAAARPDGIGVTEIAATTGLDKGTVSRLLSTLRERGYVEQRGTDRRYVLGSRCQWLGLAYAARTVELATIAKPFLIALRDATQETVHLAVAEGAYVVFLAQEQPDRAIRVTSAVGSRLPMHRAAMGRAILAALQGRARDDLLRTLEDDAEARGEPFDSVELLQDVQEAAERGWAAVDRHDEVTRLASAIVDSRGIPIAALTVSGPSYRIDGRLEQLGREVTESARALSAAL